MTEFKQDFVYEMGNDMDFDEINKVHIKQENESQVHFIHKI